MLVINTTKRALIYAIGKMKDPNKIEGNKTPDFSTGFPKDVKRIISTQEVDMESIKGLAEHPMFRGDLARGYLMMVGNGELFRSFPMKAKKDVKTKGKKKPKDSVRDIDLSSIDFEEMAKWPETLADVKSLDEFTERDAIDLVQVTVDLKTLKRWKNGEAEGGRSGLIDVIKTIITKVEAIDNEREKVGAGTED